MRAEFLLAMQTARPPRFGQIRGTSIPEITPSIAAGMCSGLRREQWLAARWVWCVDWGVFNELRELLLKEAKIIAKREKWRKDVIEDFIDLSLAESAGLSWPGRKRIKMERDRYLFLGWKKRRWYRWKTRYEAVYKIISEWEGEARDYICRVK
jgi:hypothetical protein